MWTAGGEGMVSGGVGGGGYYETPVLTLPGQLDSVTMGEGGGVVVVTIKEETPV